MNNHPRLGILIYAHDGRGLGHASRSIAIGLALRRGFPTLKVLFITGCKISQELIGPGHLDWIKLPSYETVVIDGKSKGIAGNSNFEDAELGLLRAESIKQIIRLYRPRIVLADHSPQGKHRELLPALEDSESNDTKWVLGIRGILGEVSQTKSGLAATLFRKHYCSLLWYGDTQILGTEPIEAINHQFDSSAVECGYVSRMTEIMQTSQTDFTGPSLAGTISIPWMGENSPDFLRRLATTLTRLGPQQGDWNLFLDSESLQSNEVYSYFDDIPFCTTEKPGQRYLSALMRSKMAIIYGGYNSLVDVLSLSLPAVIISRDMQDNEQQIHLHKLVQSNSENITVLTEQCSVEQLYLALHSQSQKLARKPAATWLNGAESAANHLASLLHNYQDLVKR